MIYKIYSISEDGYKLLYKKTKKPGEATVIIQDFIYGTERNHKYGIEIIKEKTK